MQLLESWFEAKAELIANAAAKAAVGEFKEHCKEVRAGCPGFKLAKSFNRLAGIAIGAAVTAVVAAVFAWLHKG
jgi:hypothetical protein